MPAEILVIREKDRFSEILTEHGFSVTNLPMISTAPLADTSELKEQLADLESYTGIFITSRAAAEIILKELANFSQINLPKFYVLGRKSLDLLEKAGIRPFFSEQATTAEELLKLIPREEIEGRKLLYLCGDRSLRTIPETLRNIADVREVVVYKTKGISHDEKEIGKLKTLAEGKFTAVCFFSLSGVEEFLRRLPDFSQGETVIAAIGKTTARYAGEKHLRIDYISDFPAAEDFAAGLIEYLRKKL